MTQAYQSQEPISRYLAEKDAIYGEPLRLFRSGKDTLQIAQIMGITEAEAHKRVSTAISHSKRRKAIFIPHGEFL